jgi:hypothetical protein
MLDLRDLTRELIAMKGHYGGRDTVEDNRVINAINQRDADLTDRTAQVVHWLTYYKVLMFSPSDRSLAIAGRIIAFADEPRDTSLHRDKDRIVFQFNRLGELISRVAASKRTGKIPALTSLTSKALWCCYPDDVPIFDKNAACALRVISRLSHLTPGPKQSEYACFVDLWLQVYKEVEPLIRQEDLSDCPHKVRVLDRMLWYLGQGSFYS